MLAQHRTVINQAALHGLKLQLQKPRIARLRTRGQEGVAVFIHAISVPISDIGIALPPLFVGPIGSTFMFENILADSLKRGASYG